MIAAMQALTADKPEGTFRFERFSGEEARLDPDREHGFTVELRDSGLTLTVRADQTLLDAIHAAGIDVASDCCEGLCGSCEVDVVDGDIDHRDKVLTRAERAENRRMMACCSRAGGDRIKLAL